jgi:hypothetical protein
MQDPDSAVARPVPEFHPTPMPEPVRPAPGMKWGMLTSVTAPAAPQLSHARSERELVPGDPEQVDALARLLDDFTNRLMDARHALQQISLESWHSHAAARVAEAMGDLLVQLTAAVNGFGAAGAAVQGYAAVHAEARQQAFRALTIWREAEHESQVFRGLVAGQSPPAGVTEDPGLYGMAVAARLLAGAQEVWQAAAKTMAAALADAEKGSPTDPGLLAHLTRGASSYGAGFTQGVVGIAQGTMQLAALGYGLLIAPAVDPARGQASWKALGSGAKYVVTDFDKFAAAVVDLKTLQEDPMLWLGKRTPEVLLAAKAVRLGGAGGYTAAAHRLRTTADTVEIRNQHNLWSRPTPTELRTLLDARNLAVGSVERAATRAQLRQIGMAGADLWYRRPLQEGQRIAVYRFAGAEYVAVVGPNVTRNASEFFGHLQVAPLRERMQDGRVGQPEFPDTVEIYEVRGDDLEAAQSRAAANPRYGAGGGVQAFVRDIEDAIDSQRLVKIGSDHTFDPQTIRSGIEDPSYREADPSLPDRALDPEDERSRAQQQELGKQAGRIAGGAAASGVYARTHPPTKVEEVENNDRPHE